MQINHINQIYKNFNINFGSKSPGSKFRTGLSEDVFEKTCYGNLHTKSIPFSSGADYIRYIRTGSKETELKLSNISKETKEAAEKSLKAAIAMKGQFDKEFGRDNYVFVSIGTSPAGIARGFEFLGVETKYIPISGVGRTMYNVDELLEIQDTKEYAKFLDSIGLTKEQTERNGKHLIFCDYTSEGTTLRAAEYVAREVRNLPEDKLHFRSVQEVLKKASETEEEKEFFEQYVIDYLRDLKIEKYSNTPHLECTDVNSITSVLQNKQPDDVSDFNFAMLNYIDKKGLLKGGGKVANQF